MLIPINYTLCGDLINKKAYGDVFLFNMLGYWTHAGSISVTQ
jgi:hypothetical protein